MRSSIVAIIGPTASGKSSLAVSLARRVNGEVVNADSMQLYEGMDIGTAKLAEPDRQAVPHHLLDVWPVTMSATVADYQRLANEVVEQIHQRRAIPILVGGSGLYVNAVVDQWQIPGTDSDVRRVLEGELAMFGTHVMHERLVQIDRSAAADILPTDGRRIVRALEVNQISGRFRSRLPAGERTNDRVLIGLDVPREVLNDRIEQRVSAMWEAGLLDEVRTLLAAGLLEGATASRALGYSQALAHLAGEFTQEQAQLRTVAATRRFARRQLAWFRRDSRITWLAFDDPQLVDHAQKLVTEIDVCA